METWSCACWPPGCGLWLRREGAGQEACVARTAAAQAQVPGAQQLAARAAAAISRMRGGAGCLAALDSWLPGCWWRRPCAGGAWWCINSVD
jgi:hypothetical protein